MRTLILSDLHLGAVREVDLLRRAELRAPLIEAVRDGVDRVVLLGDALELRERPVRAALPYAFGLFEDLGRALGPDGEIVLVGGNHDHELVAGWIETHLTQDPAHSLGLEQRIAPDEAGPLARELAEHATPARLTLSYPGLWVRDDVYALHGHYLDLHTTVPTFERLAAGAMGTWVAPLPADGATPDDYEAALAPIFAWIWALAQRSDHGSMAAGAGASARAWAMLAGRERRRPVRAIALGAGFAGAVGVLNRLGVGPLSRDLSGAGLRRGGLRGVGEVVRRLGIDAGHVIFGHTHRSGPWPRDDVGEWTAPTGARLVNVGSWVYQRHFLSDRPNDSPYWPGTVVLVDDAGPPRLVRLLGDRGHEELAPARAGRA